MYSILSHIQSRYKILIPPFPNEIKLGHSILCNFSRDSRDPVIQAIGRPEYEDSLIGGLNVIMIILTPSQPNLITATLTINRHLACLWSKIGTFQVGVELCKRATIAILNKMIKNTIESFQMRYCMQFFLQGHQNCQNLKIYTSKVT